MGPLGVHSIPTYNAGIVFPGILLGMDYSCIKQYLSQDVLSTVFTILGICVQISKAVLSFGYRRGEKVSAIKL